MLERRSGLKGRDVALYWQDSHELEVLVPIGEELARRGATVRTTDDMAAPAGIGLFACHTSALFDFSAAKWKLPRTACSVQSLHDLDSGRSDDYFVDESWHIFDLGLLPGPSWMRAWARAEASGTPGPLLGMREVGWPKADHVDADPAAFAAATDALRDRLGLGGRPVVLLACSWSTAGQLRDTLEHLDTADHDIVVKYPASVLPPKDSPWHDRLTQAYDEMQVARSLACQTPSVAVADDDTDIMTLVGVADVVLSDGSNVLFEGVVAGVPGVCIRQWSTYVGERGERTVPPNVSVPGVLTGDLSELRTMVELVLDPRWAVLTAASGAELVTKASRGGAAARAVEAIEDAVARTDAWSPAERDRLVDRSLTSWDERKPLVMATRQLRASEDELRTVREALRQSDEREQVARVTLQDYERELAELRARPRALKRKRPFA